MPKTMVEMKMEAPIRALQGRNKLQSLNISIYLKIFSTSFFAMFEISAEEVPSDGLTLTRVLVHPASEQHTQ